MIERVVSAGATVTTTIEYREQREPQVIERPSAAAWSSNAPPEPNLPPELSDRGT
jgi:hypothetical protein